MADVADACVVLEICTVPGLPRLSELLWVVADVAEACTMLEPCTVLELTTLGELF